MLFCPRQSHPREGYTHRDKMYAILYVLGNYYKQTGRFPDQLTELNFNAYKNNPLKWEDKQRGVSLNLAYFPDVENNSSNPRILVACPLLEQRDPATKELQLSSMPVKNGERIVILDNLMIEYLSEEIFQDRIVQQEGENPFRDCGGTTQGGL